MSTPKQPHPDEPLWKLRYEMLQSLLSDAFMEANKYKFDKDGKRAFVIAKTVYVSYSLDVTDSIDYAEKNFGKGCFDTYRLVKKGTGE